MWSYGGIFLTFFIIFKAKSKISERRHTPIITPDDAPSGASLWLLKPLLPGASFSGLVRA